MFSAAETFIGGPPIGKPRAGLFGSLPSLVGRGCLTIRDWDEGFDRRIAAWVVSARRTGDLVRLPFGSGQKSEARGIQRTPRAHLVCYSATLTDKQVTRCP